MHYALAAAVLFVFWVLLSGYFSPFLLSIGAASAVAVVLLARRMAVMAHEDYPIRLGARTLLYWPWLFKEIAISAWKVAWIILQPRLPISPMFVCVRPTQRTVVGRVTYANSITLTPGTITIDAEGDEFIVHALTRAGAAALAEGEMDRRVTRFEGSR
jgi:multicomponent Na+:H+ antiporter subunit E